MALLGLAIVLLLILVAAFAPLLAPQSPIAQDLAHRLQPPSAAHWLGTDELGRDIYARIVWGSRITLTIVALVAVIIGPVGLLVGTVAGYAGGWLDTVLMRLTDIFLAFPRLILALAFVAALGPGIENAIIAIAITAWPPYARLARAETLAVRHSDFIAAAKMQGASPARIVAFPHRTLVHLLPGRPADARHGRHHPDRRRPWLPGPRRPAADAGMGGHDLQRPSVRARLLVGRHHAGPRHRHRQPGLQPAGRRPARRARPQAALAAGPQKQSGTRAVHECLRCLIRSTPSGDGVDEGSL